MYFLEILLRMQYEMCAVTDDFVKMLDLVQSVVAKHALGCWEAARAVCTIEAEIILEVPASRFERAGMPI
jgi:hypothetical protein